MMYVGLFIIKVIDNILGTIKSIATYKEQKILSSILVVISQLIFYLVVSQVISDNSLLAILIVAISSGLGNYIAFLINDKYKSDDKWWIYITTSDIGFMNDFCCRLSHEEIKYSALKGFDKRGEDSIHVIVFSKTKAESKLVDEILNSSNKKYLLEIMK